jgi:ABC-2 type transport system permease protein
VVALSNLWNLVLNENMKIYRRPRTWIMAALVVIAVVAFAVLMRSVGPGDRDTDALQFMNAAAAMSFLAFIFSVVIAADIVAGEFTWGTIKLLLIRPANRSKVLLSKYIAVLLFMLLMIALLFISSLAAGFVVFGPPQGATPLTLGDIVKDYGYRLVDVLMNVTFAFMISTVFRSSALAISLAFVIMFVSGTVMGLLISLGYDWAKYILFANTNLAVYENGGKPPIEGMTLGFSITMLIIYYVVFVGLSWYIFRKRDVAG